VTRYSKTCWQPASRSLPKVTELVMRNWSLDFHWYPEGCWSDPGRCSGFRTIDDVAGPKGGFAGQDVARGSNLCNIADSAAGKLDGKKSSYVVADEMQADATQALSLINTLQSGTDADLKVAINNVKQMSYLSRYYAHKIRGATYKKAAKLDLAKEEMGKAYCWWITYTRSMGETYLPDSFRNLEIAPDWKYGDAAVLKEYTDLGGEGIPDCENLFTLTTQAIHGAISMEPSGGVYSKDTVVTVTADPAFGYAFNGWGGNLEGSVSPTTIQMDAKKNVKANFIESKGDETPWVETFTMADGIKSHGAPTSWRSKRSSGMFQVAGNRLMINGGSGDSSEEGIFETAEITLPNGSVKVSMDVQSAAVDGSDYVRLFKIVDGGAPVQIGEITDHDKATFEGANITGKKLKLRITARVSASDEFYYMDNLKVE
jgi:Divergent InlB B-repeat domain